MTNLVQSGVIHARDCLKLDEGFYTGTTEDGLSVFVLRGKKGNGFTIKYEQNGKDTLVCVDYDEDGNVECEYVEY